MDEGKDVSETTRMKISVAFGKAAIARGMGISLTEEQLTSLNRGMTRWFSNKATGMRADFDGPLVRDVCVVEWQFENQPAIYDVVRAAKIVTYKAYPTPKTQIGLEFWSHDPPPPSPSLPPPLTRLDFLRDDPSPPTSPPAPQQAAAGAAAWSNQWSNLTAVGKLLGLEKIINVDEGFYVRSLDLFSKNFDAAKRNKNPIMVSTTGLRRFKRGGGMLEEQAEFLGFPTLNVVVYIAVADGALAATGPRAEVDMLFCHADDMVKLTDLEKLRVSPLQGDTHTHARAHTHTHRCPTASTPAPPSTATTS